MFLQNSFGPTPTAKRVSNEGVRNPQKQPILTDFTLRFKAGCQKGSKWSTLGARPRRNAILAFSVSAKGKPQNDKMVPDRVGSAVTRVGIF